MSQRIKTLSNAMGRIAVVMVLGAGIGTALGSLLGDVTLGIGMGVAVGVIAGLVWEFQRRRIGKR